MTEMITRTVRRHPIRLSLGLIIDLVGLMILAVWL